MRNRFTQSTISQPQLQIRFTEPNSVQLSMWIDCYAKHWDSVMSLTVSYCSLKGEHRVFLSWQDALYATYKSFLLQSGESLRCRASNNLMHITQDLL